MPPSNTDPISEEGPHVSLRDIADAVGCSHSSVARALKGENRVGPELRKRILETAEEMGYRPNPMVASLMAIHNRKRERKHLTANIGWINSNPNKDFWHNYSYNKVFIEAAEQRAREHGFGFEEVWAGEPGMTGRRLNDILLTRGIQGMVFSATTKDLVETGFDPSHFAGVSIRDDLPGQLMWHRSGTSGRKNAELAFTRLRALGYRRIGLLLGLSAAGDHTSDQELEDLIERFNSEAYIDHSLLPLGFHRQLLSGFYYVQQSIDPAERVRPFAFDHCRPNCAEILGAYLRDAKLDAVLCHNGAIIEGAKVAGLTVPDDLAIAHLGLADDVRGWAGVETHAARQAAAAIDLLSSQILRNERGVPQFSQFVHVEGEWRDGWTAKSK